ncbi:hypothetical protein PVK06_038248 [Gossypium arboreum]|uniref:Uncharacterized protein n=1 Tax=Gossypium arboreum TaxID=29729 RepID=A0ABR0N1H3_GOSAR|nr:hypothetical protein PVK06_038248 [Gossypium arboreum]
MGEPYNSKICIHHMVVVQDTLPTKIRILKWGGQIVNGLNVGPDVLDLILHSSLTLLFAQVIQDTENVLETTKAELEDMRRENIYMEERLIAWEKAIEENKAIEELADDLLRNIGVDAGSHNLNENNGLP